MRPALSFLALFAIVSAAGRAAAQVPAAPPGTPAAPAPFPPPPAPAPAAPSPPRVGTGWASPLRINYSAEIEFRLGTGTDGCEREAYLHQEVGRQLGYDPLVADAQREPVGRFVVELDHSERGFSARVRRIKLDGTLAWDRREDAYDTCKEVIKAAATTLANEFTLLAAQAPEPEPPAPTAAPSPPPAPAPVAPSLLSPGEPSAPRRPGSQLPQVELGVSAFASIGTAPSVTGGGALHVGVVVASFDHDRARLSVAAEGSVDVPITGKNSVRTQLFAFSPMVCGHKDLLPGARLTWGFFGCVLGTAGVLRISSGAEQFDFATRAPAYGAVGGRAGVQARLASGIAFRAQAEVLPSIHAAKVDVPGRSGGTGSTAINLGLALVFPL
jgi:hypothetical protein